MLAATKVEMNGNEKKVNRNTYNTSSIKRVTRKFHVVVVQNNGKEVYQKSVQSCFLQIRKKGVLHVQSVVLFLLIRPTDFFGCFRCLRPLALHDLIFCLVNYRY